MTVDPIDRVSRFAECLACQRPEADDVRAFLGSCSDEDIAVHSAPSGRLLLCCRIRHSAPIMSGFSGVPSGR
jgi:hypothetical protein